MHGPKVHEYPISAASGTIQSETVERAFEGVHMLETGGGGEISQPSILRIV
jgi:hypothetical protein